MFRGGIDLNLQKADRLILNLEEPAHVRKPRLERLYFLKTNGEPLLQRGLFALLGAFRGELKGGNLLAGA